MKIDKSRLRIFGKFFVMGVVTCVSSFLISINWSNLYAYFAGQEFVFDFQPRFLKFLHQAVSYASWLVGAAIFIYQLRRRKILPSLGFFTGAVSVYLCFLSYLFCGPAISDYMSREAFDSQKWIQAEKTNDPIRIHMVDDLLKNHNLNRMKKSEVNDFLGVPKQTEYFREYDYVYWLGPERGFISIDSEWLGIKFENDIVVDVRLLRD